MEETILLKDTINVTIGDDHSYNCNTVAIGRAGENNITQLEITIPEELNTFGAYLDFKTSKGETHKTPQLEIFNNIIEYNIPIGLLKNAGNLEVQLVLQNENGEIWKSNTKKYVVLKSLDAVDDIPFQDDFIHEANRVLNEATEMAQDALEKNTEVNEKYDACVEATKEANEATEEARAVRAEIEAGGFIDSLKEQNNGGTFSIWVGTQAEKDAEEEKNNCLYIVEDDTLPVDFTIERGKIGDWDYKKTASGDVECWGMIYVTPTKSYPIGSLYYSDPIELELPIKMKNVVFDVLFNDFLEWAVNSTSRVSDNVIAFRVMRATEIELNTPIGARIIVKGVLAEEVAE